MPPQTARSLMKDFRNSFRRKKVDSTPKVDTVKEAENALQATLLEMKENLGEKLLSIYSDTELVGFLRARNLNVTEAVKLVKVDENAKRFLRVEEYEPPSEIYPYNFSGLIGFDKEGSVVRVINVGGLDPKGIMHTLSTMEITKILIRMINLDFALQEEENKKTGRTNKQFVYIMNLENLSMSQVSCKPAFDTAIQSIKLLQDHYHDVIKKVYFINTPSFFSSVFKLFKPVILDSLQKSIEILDNENWKEELLKVIDKDVLPAYLGGDRVDSTGDPKCREFIYFGSVVPESKYASNFLDENDPEVVSVNLAAGATLNYRFPVRQVGSIVKWHVQSKDNDLAVGVFVEPSQSGNETPRTRKRRDEDMSKFEALTPIFRTQCHICPEEGSTVLWFTGNIVMHLDNSYSWMNSKDVLFKISVTPPNETEKNNKKSSIHAARG